MAQEIIAGLSVILIILGAGMIESTGIGFVVAVTMIAVGLGLAIWLGNRWRG